MEKKQNWAKAKPKTTYSSKGKKNDTWAKKGKPTYGSNDKQNDSWPKRDKTAYNSTDKQKDSWQKRGKPAYGSNDKQNDSWAKKDKTAYNSTDKQKDSWQKREKPAYDQNDKQNDFWPKKESSASPMDKKKDSWQKREKPAYSPKDKKSDFWPKKEKNVYGPRDQKSNTWPQGKRRSDYNPKESQGEALRPAENEDDREIIAGKNSVLEALQSELTVNKVWLCLGSDTAYTDKLLALCRGKKVPWQIVDKEAIERIAGAHHQGVAAACTPFCYTELEDILAQAKESGRPPFLLLLAGVEDPHNFGSIIRTAECVGVHGLIIPKRRSVAVNQTVLRVSAGAAAYLPIARVNNLPQTVDFLQKQGIWVIGAHMTGAVTMWDVQLTGPLCLMVGGEGQGIPELLQKKCDELVSIPQWGKISSLNVANAAAILLYEIARQKKASL